MNFNPNLFNPVVVNPPIIHRRVRDINRVFITEQPHIIEDQTRIFNQHILRHTCCVRPTCCEFNSCCVENCCNIPGIVDPCCGPVCPGQCGSMGPGFGGQMGPDVPMGPGPGGPGFGPRQFNQRAPR